MSDSFQESTTGQATPAGDSQRRPGPVTVAERVFAEVLADVVNVDHVPVDSDFFAELGANSLVMAHFCARTGTPFKSLVWRTLGVRIGRRVFDDGCTMPENTLVAIGDDVTLNVFSKLQCHSQEDGTFKADRITIGSGCSIGVGALVHYGVTMGDDATLTADSFLMKGEQVPPHERWSGNPATSIGDGGRPRIT